MVSKWSDTWPIPSRIMPSIAPRNRLHLCLLNAIKGLFELRMYARQKLKLAKIHTSPCQRSMDSGPSPSHTHSNWPTRCFQIATRANQTWAQTSPNRTEGSAGLNHLGRRRQMEKTPF